MASDAEITSLADVPGYKAILKAVLKTQIQGLVEQLASHTDEESVLLTANVSDGTISHLGSNSGRTFLTSQDDLKSQFLGFCIKMHHQHSLADQKHSTNSNKQPTLADPNRSMNSNIQQTLDLLKSTSSHKARRPGNKQRPIPYNVKNRPLLSNSVKSTPSDLNQESGPVSVTTPVLSQESGPVMNQDDGTVTLIIKQEPKSDDENSTISNNFKLVTMETERNSTTQNDSLNNSVSDQSSASWIDPVCNDHLVDNHTGRGGHQLNFTQESPAGPVSEADRREIDDLLANTSALKFNMKRKLSFKTYETKYAAILEVERGQQSKTQIAKQFKVPVTTLLTWLKHKNTIKEKLSDNLSPHRKTAKKPYFNELDKRLYAWYLNILDKRIQVNGMILREKACHFAKEIGMRDFQFGAGGWVDRFKARHAISFKQLSTNTATEICSWTINEEASGGVNVQVLSGVNDEASGGVNKEASWEVNKEASGEVNEEASGEVNKKVSCDVKKEEVSCGVKEDLLSGVNKVT